VGGMDICAVPASMVWEWRGVVGRERMGGELDISSWQIHNNVGDNLTENKEGWYCTWDMGVGYWVLGMRVS
jgi:hypothetical protein